MANELTDWTPPQQLCTTNIEVLKLALAQADNRQKDLEATSSNITTRVQNLLTVLVGIVVASIGFFFSHLNDSFPIIIPTLATILYSLVLSIYLFNKAYTGEYMPPAGNPSKVLSADLFDDPFEDKLRHIYINLLYGANKRFIENHAENQRRWKIVKRSIKAAFFMPIILMAIYLVVLFWDHLQDFLFQVGHLGQ
ncbi:hypothetical protein [Fibrisoma limi]|uniref:hypothetical protein n=1 Tax=Fibrisoma limi TaxID=663275 RepID=UPI000587EC19|nr:hypothetical protein [Fibrisoma limi]